MIPWAVVCQVPLFLGFPRQEYWSGLPFPSPGNLPNPGIEPGPPALQTDSLPSEQGIYELLMLYYRNLSKQRRGRRGLAIKSEGARDSIDV